MIDLIIAILLDLVLGDPEDFPHPVKLMGKIISFEEKIFRKLFKEEMLYFAGFLIVVINLSLAFFIPFYILKVIKPFKIIYHIVNIYLLYTTIAARCLADEANKVHSALKDSIQSARRRVSYIVGRDTNNLNETEIVRATIETVSENTSDGVIAPLFYASLYGAPLALCYKMVNTMDSMLGYKNERFKRIGFFPAKTDDVFNFIPARLTGLLMILTYPKQINRSFRIMIRDRKNHKSPNCAYPEAATAGILGVLLGGNNYYFGELVEKPTIGDYLRPLQRDDIKKSIQIMYRTEFLYMALYIIVWWCLR
ncbi:adenosylcobinamide-phosphate synthase CbiB [Caloramator sp. mosi_1]|uniref:adenosylcobinamide-phosphate synthase CbiB n=1 Tax=Caloramator sp. mosi_1 TaxID=3023090 RepID=UPI002360A433|nr:adenosylcobinamide-phosphate synthase CbiB [Caloramator sp. mosi_1]WDC84924.1 adenosylcobinamide-phosphate synthase CbiB [Caloramator sp. mosi_1]